MLQKLHIQNYAIIHELEIDFSKHLNIITGETGAGKSILMGALNLILGERADTAVLQQKESKCVVEGSFLIKPSPDLKDFFAENQLDFEEEILLRREIAATGKSRSFINDTPVNLSQLRALAVLMVDLHQQFDTLSIAESGFQRKVLDALADNSILLSQLAASFAAYSNYKKQLDRLQQQQADASKELDYNRFLYAELEELNLKENELEELDAELALLSNSENIKQQLSAISYELSESDSPVLSQLKMLLQKIASLESFHPSLRSLAERMRSSMLELQDINGELDHINDSIQYSAERIQTVNDRIGAGYKLQKKHGVHDTAGLLEIQRSLEQKLDSILNIDTEIEKLQSLSGEAFQKARALAEEISTRRKAQVAICVKKVNQLLQQVGMPNARLQIELQDAPLHADGIDTISFLFDANKSDRFEPLYKVASGGELSRLMLSVKSLVAQKLQLPTLIFDEIDTGISGEAAKQVGIIMKELAKSHQVISITHQPQIAARADAHYFVYKEIVDDKVHTSIRRLSNDERITAIAKMLSGEKPTAAALENAREMVGN